MEDNENQREQLRLKLNYIDNLNTQLSQRVNYFLIGNAFLIAAFVALIVVKRFQTNPYFVYLAALICATAYILSLFFSEMNYTDSNNYKGFAKNIAKRPELCHLQWLDWIWKSRKDLQVSDLNVPHVFLIPLGFTCFWLLVMIGLYYYIKCNLGTSLCTFVFVSILAGLLGLITIIEGIRCCRNNKNHRFLQWIITLVLLTPIVLMIFLACGCLQRILCH
jgi:hypothetical protein